MTADSKTIFLCKLPSSDRCHLELGCYATMKFLTIQAPLGVMNNFQGQNGKKTSSTILMKKLTMLVEVKSLLTYSRKLRAARLQDSTT